MRLWLPVLLLLAGAGSGCRTAQKAVSTEYRYVIQRDSVVAERWDTVRVEVRGDTVRIIERYHEREYRSTIYRDTLRRCDTLRIERVTVERAGERRKGRWWAWMLAGSLLTAALGIAARIIIKAHTSK